MDTIRTSVGDDGGGECDPVSAPPRCHNYYALQHLLKHHLQRFDRYSAHTLSTTSLPSTPTLGAGPKSCGGT